MAFNMAKFHNIISGVQETGVFNQKKKCDCFFNSKLIRRKII